MAENLDDLYSNLSSDERFKSLFDNKEEFEQYLASDPTADKTMEDIFDIKSASEYLKKKDQASSQNLAEESSSSPSLSAGPIQTETETTEVVEQPIMGVPQDNKAVEAVTTTTVAPEKGAEVVETTTTIPGLEETVSLSPFIEPIGYGKGAGVGPQTTKPPGKKPSDIIVSTGTKVWNKEGKGIHQYKYLPLYNEIEKLSKTISTDPKILETKLNEFVSAYKELKPDAEIKSDFDFVINQAKTNLAKRNLTLDISAQGAKIAFKKPEEKPITFLPVKEGPFKPKTIEQQLDDLNKAPNTTEKDLGVVDYLNAYDRFTNPANYQFSEMSAGTDKIFGETEENRRNVLLGLPTAENEFETPEFLSTRLADQEKKVDKIFQGDVNNIIAKIQSNLPENFFDAPAITKVTRKVMDPETKTFKDITETVRNPNRKLLWGGPGDDKEGFYMLDEAGNVKVNPIFLDQEVEKYLKSPNGPVTQALVKTFNNKRAAAGLDEYTKDQIINIIKPRVLRLAGISATQKLESDLVERKMADKKFLKDDVIKVNTQIDAEIKDLGKNAEKLINDYNIHLVANTKEKATSFAKEAEQSNQLAYDAYKLKIQSNPMMSPELQNMEYQNFLKKVDENATAYEERLNALNKEANAVLQNYRAKVQQDGEAQLSQIKKKYGIISDKDENGKLTTLAYRKYREAYKNEFDKLSKEEQANSDALGWRLGDIIQSTTSRMFGNAIQSINAAVGYEDNPIGDVLKFMDYFQIKNQVNIKPFSEVLEKEGFFSTETFKNIAQNIVQQAPNLVTSIAAGALSGNPYIAGGILFAQETIDQVAENHRLVYERTGSIEQAQDAAAETLKTQILMSPLYTISMLPFTKGFLSKYAPGLGLKSFGLKFGVSTGLEQIEETGVEMGQQYLSYKNSTPNPVDFATWAMQNGKNVAIDVTPTIFVLGGTSAGLEQYREVQTEQAKNRVMATLGRLGMVQNVTDIAQVIGSKSVMIIPEYLYRKNLISDAELKDMRTAFQAVVNELPNAQELVKDQDSQKYYITLATEKLDVERKIAEAKDENFKKLLEERVKAIDKKLADVAAGKPLQLTKITYSNGSSMVVDNTQMQSFIKDPKFLDDITEEGTKVESTDGNINKIVEETKKQKETQAKEATDKGAKQLAAVETTARETGATIEEQEKLNAIAEKARQSGQENVDTILGEASTLQRALNEIAPGAKIVFLNNNDYVAAMQQVGGKASSAGNFSYRKNEDGTYSVEVQINLDKATTTTLAHEVGHGILLRALGSDPKLFNDMRTRLKKTIQGTIRNESLRQIEALVDKYNNNEKGEEFLVELAATLKQNEKQMEIATLEKIAKVIADFVAFVTGGQVQIFDEIKTRADYVDFVNGMVETLRTGQIAQGVQKKIQATETQPAAEVTATEEVVAPAETAPEEGGVPTETQVEQEIKPTELSSKSQTIEAFNGVLEKLGINIGTTTKAGKPKVTNYDIAAAMNKYYEKVHKKFDITDFSDEVVNVVSDYAKDEIIFALTEFGSNSGKGWYTEDYGKALDILSQLDEEITKNPAIKEVATAIIAVASNSTDVYTNLTRVIYGIEEFRKTGKVPNNVGTGKGASAIAAGVDRYNNLLTKFNGDSVKLAEFLQQIDTISNLQEKLLTQLGVKSYAEAKKLNLATDPEWNSSEVLPMSVLIFGPKIGAFYSNLSGLDGTPTIDRWCIRTIYRYRGDMRSKVSEKEMEDFKRDNKIEGVSYSDAISLAQEHAKLFNAILTGKGEFKNLPKEKRNELLKPYRKGSQIWAKAEGVVNEITEGIESGVENKAKYAKDFRSFTKKAFEEARDKVFTETGEKLSVSDVQAILWIYEKNLFGHLGVKQKEDSTYSAASNTLVNKVNSNQLSLEKLKAGDLSVLTTPDIQVDGSMGDIYGTTTEEFKQGIDNVSNRNNENVLIGAQPKQEIAETKTADVIERAKNIDNFMSKSQAVRSEKSSGTTQVATTTGSYVKAANLIADIKGDVLDYGAGLGLGTDAMSNTLGRKVDSFEPNPERWQGKEIATFTSSDQINKKYDAIVSLNVLNVVPKDIRDAIVIDIFDKLKPGGKAVISTRGWVGDVNGAKNATPGPEEKSLIITRRQGGETVEVFQKGFDANELVDYVQGLLGDQATVVKNNTFGKSGVIITKNVETAPQFKSKSQLDFTQIRPEYDAIINQTNGDKVAAYTGLVEKGYTPRRIKEAIGLYDFDETALKQAQSNIAINTMDKVGTAFSDRQELIKQEINNNLGNVEAIYGDLIDQGYSNLEIFTAARDMDFLSPQDLIDIFGADYRQTVQNALNRSTEYPADFLDELEAEAQNLKVTQKATEVADIVRNTGIGLVDSAVAIEFFLDYLKSNGFDQIAIALSEGVKQFANDRGMLEKAADWTQSLANGQFGDKLYTPEAISHAFNISSELFSQAGRILQLARFFNETNQLGMIEKQLARAGVALTENQRKTLEALINDFKAAQKDNKAKREALEKDWSDQAYEAFWDSEKAVGIATIKIAQFLEARKPIFWNERVTSGSARALLNISTTILSFVANIENNIWSTNFAARSIQKLRDFFGSGIKGNTLSISNWQMARKLTSDRMWFDMNRNAKYGVLDTNRGLNRYYDNLAQVNFFKDAQWAYNFVKAFVNKTTGKDLSSMTPEEQADAFDLTLTKLKDGTIELRDGKTYTLARSLAWTLGTGPVLAGVRANPWLLLNTGGPIAAEITGRAMAYGGDIAFGYMAAQRAMIDYFQNIQGTRFQNGVFDSMLTDANGNLDQNALRAMSQILYADAELYARFETEGLKRTLLANNMISGAISLGRGSLRKKIRGLYQENRVEIGGPTFGSEIKRQFSAKGLRKNTLQLLDVGLFTLMPFTKVPVNFLGSAIMKVVPGAAFAKYIVSEGIYQYKWNQFNKEYPIGVKLKSEKSKRDYEKAKIDLFFAKRQATYDAAQTVTSVAIYGFAMSAVKAGAILIGGDDPEKEKALKKYGLRGGLYNATIHWEYMRAGMPSNFLARRGGYKETDVILNTRNAGFLGYALNTWGSVYNKQREQENDNVMQIFNEQKNALTLMLSTSLSSGIEDLPMFSGLARLGQVATDLKNPDSSKQAWENFASGTLSTSMAVFFPSFFSFMSKGNAEFVQSANDIVTRAEKPDWPAFWGPIGLRVVQKLNRNISFNEETRNEFYDAAIGPFGEDLGYKVTLAEPGTAGAYFQAIFDPIAFRSFSSPVKQQQKEIQKYRESMEVHSGMVNLALIYQQMTGRDYEWTATGKTSGMFGIISNPMKNNFTYIKEMTLGGDDAPNVYKGFDYQLPNDLYRQELKKRGDYFQSAFAKYGQQFKDVLIDVQTNVEKGDIETAKSKIVNIFNQYQDEMIKAKNEYMLMYRNSREKDYLIEMQKRNLFTPEEIQKMINIGLANTDGLIL
jgi:SAM-dependent methyltransferase